jgi:hypothetical protein
MRLLPISVVALAGCTATLPPGTSEEHATITFQNHEVMPYFENVDGQDLRNAPATVIVKPGEHTVRYSCVLHVDGPPNPKITMRFRAGKTYAFNCTGDGLAAVVER